jgi:hypothetical protein
MSHSHLATLPFLATKTLTTTSEAEAALLHQLYASRRDFIPEILASNNSPAVMAEWQLATANYEQQHHNKCETPEEIALLLGAEAVNG